MEQLTFHEIEYAFDRINPEEFTAKMFTGTFYIPEFKNGVEEITIRNPIFPESTLFSVMMKDITIPQRTAI